jgi:uncharacterized protein YndB with AHSA1/START domain
VLRDKGIAEGEPMNENYGPGPAGGAHVEKHDGPWTLVVVRDIPHPPAKVWKALTESAQLREWAPFDPDRDLGREGPAKLTTVGAPAPQVSDIRVKQAEPPRLLEYTWGGQDLRWELEPLGKDRTRLTLRHNVDERFVSMGAAGWHICLDVLERLVAGEPIGRRVGMGLMQDAGWQRLNAEYAAQFGVENPVSSAGKPR